MLRQVLSRLSKYVRSGDESDDGVRTDGGTVPESETNISRLLESTFVRSLPFWAPGAFLVALFVYGAILWNIVISLTDWQGLGSPKYQSFNFDTYVRFFEAVFAGSNKFLGVVPVDGPAAYWALRNTFVLLVVFTVAALILGLLLAILVDQEIRFENTFRTIYLLPMSLSFVVTAVFWAWLYDAEGGLINVILRGVGLDFLAYTWLGDPKVKLAAVIFALVWQFSGYCMVVYLAGLRAIPSDQFEAAKVDGASLLVTYWKVILPQLRSSTVSAAVVLMVFALKAFDFLFVMFGSQPGPSVDILAMMMYREAFASDNWAYGSAIATILFLFTISIIGPYLYRQYKVGEL